MRPRIAAQRSFRPCLEALETRALLSVCTVDRLTDKGEGSGLAGDLRYCLTQAQDGDAVVITVEGTVNLTRALPDLTRDIIIVGPGADVLTVRRDTGGDYRILTVGSEADVIILGLTVSNGRSNTGGGIRNVGSLALFFTTVSGNRASVSKYGDGGGGIANDGSLAIFHTTISGNRSEFGGGVANFQGAVLYMTNSTVSTNEAGHEIGLGFGGGLINLNGLLLLDSCTITNNLGDGGGGIATLSKSPDSATVLRSSIVANNIGYDIAGEIDSAGHNLVGNSDGALGFEKTDLLDVDPLLGPLADNGGPTLTHALLPGSPAIDAGDPTRAGAWDQRGDGYTRLVGQGIDIGAYEVQAERVGSSWRAEVAGFLAQVVEERGKLRAGAPWSLAH